LKPFRSAQCVEAFRHSSHHIGAKSLRMDTEGTVAATGSGLGCASDGRLPSEHEKAMTAKRAPVGLKEPLECLLHGISSACASKIDGSAMWTACGEKAHSGAAHGPTSTLTAPAWSNSGGGQLDGRPQRGLLRAPPSVVRAFSGRAPKPRPVPSRAQPAACVDLAIFGSSASFYPAAVQPPNSRRPPQPHRSWPRSLA
jgi:hypothetical protein